MISAMNPIITVGTLVTFGILNPPLIVKSKNATTIIKKVILPCYVLLRKFMRENNNISLHAFTKKPL